MTTPWITHTPGVLREIAEILASADSDHHEFSDVDIRDLARSWLEHVDGEAAERELRVAAEAQVKQLMLQLAFTERKLAAVTVPAQADALLADLDAVEPEWLTILRNNGAL